MLLVDLPSLVIVAVPLLAAAISGRFGRASLVVADAIVLPVGLTATFIGLVQMLLQLDDPTEIGPAVSVAMYSSLYVAVVKFGLTVRLSGDRRPVEDPGMHGWMAAGLTLLVLLAGMMLGSPLAAFFDLWSLGYLWLGAGAIVGLVWAGEGTNVIAPLARYLPFVGLLVLFGSNVAILQVLDDPTSLGPIIAIGLLSHLYTNVTAIILNLVRPDLAEPNRPIVQWLYWGGSIAGVCVQLGLTVAAVY
ncbi:MAG: hypothetical protein QGG40_02775 [Myxococcota bacterium]|jgi:hypothetical protein|nr:hypothetical protein [Myxococcota bacterium]